MASASNNLAVLKWRRENGCPWDADTAAAASRHGNEDVLAWLRENGCPGMDDYEMGDNETMMKQMTM
jgi:hypothetical protein